MKCSECGGKVICMQHTVYRTDGGSSGAYSCEDCGRSKGWEIKGTLKDEIIDMRDEK